MHVKDYHTYLHFSTVLTAVNFDQSVRVTVTMARDVLIVGACVKLKLGMVISAAVRVSSMVESDLHLWQQRLGMKLTHSKVNRFDLTCPCSSIASTTTLHNEQR